MGKFVEFESSNQDPLSLAKRFVFPLYSHKIASDNSGKHENWPPIAHKVAEIGAVAMDIGVNYAVMEFLNRREIGAAATTTLVYRAAVELIPDQIAQISKTVIGRTNT